MQLLFLMVGGAAGAICRFMIGNLTIKTVGNANVITGTVLANCIGGFFAGFVFSWLLTDTRVSQEVVLFLSVGFLGSLTTFSTFALETVQLFKKEKFPQLFAYLFLQLIVVLACTAIGMWIAQQIFGDLV